MVFLRIKTQI